MSTRRLRILAVVAIIVGIVALLCFAAVPPTPQKVSLTVLGFLADTHRSFMVARLTNAGPHSIRYWGYETNSPWYSYRFQDQGRTTNYCPFWCGTGVRECGLPAGHGVDFLVRAIERNGYQVALEYKLPSLVDDVRDKAPRCLATRLPTTRSRWVVSAPLKGNAN